MHVFWGLIRCALRHEMDLEYLWTQALQQWALDDIPKGWYVLYLNLEEFQDLVPVGNKSSFPRSLLCWSWFMLLLLTLIKGGKSSKWQARREILSGVRYSSYVMFLICLLTTAPSTEDSYSPCVTCYCWCLVLCSKNWKRTHTTYICKEKVSPSPLSHVPSPLS